MTDSAIDKAVYDVLCDTTGSEFVADLVDTFLEEAPRLLAELRRARSEGHGERFRRAAHSLKSNGNTFGAHDLAAQARALELEGLAPEASHDDAALNAIEEAYGRAAAELKALRND